MTGAQLFWHPPVEGLRVGGTFLRASIDFNLTLERREDRGADHGGTRARRLRRQARHLAAPGRPVGCLGASTRPRTGCSRPSTVALVHAPGRRRCRPGCPTFDEDERALLRAWRRIGSRAPRARRVLLGLCTPTRRSRRPRHDEVPEAVDAWQRDRRDGRYDVNDHWLWKLEGHFIDGIADLSCRENPNPGTLLGPVPPQDDGDVLDASACIAAHCSRSRWSSRGLASVDASPTTSSFKVIVNPDNPVDSDRSRLPARRRT